MKTVPVTALAAIGFAGMAYAGDATSPKALSDNEMDQVTAAGIPGGGRGVLTARTNAPTEDIEARITIQGIETANGHTDFQRGVGAGVCTANRPICN